MKKNVILIFCIFSMFSVFCTDWKSELQNQFISESSITLGSYELGNNYKREKNTLKIDYNLECIGIIDGKYIIPYKKIELPETLDIFKDFYLKNDGFLYGKIPNEPLSYEPVKEVSMIFGNEFSFAIPNMTSWLKIGTEEYKKALYQDGTYLKKERREFSDKNFFNYVVKNVKSSSHLVETSHGIVFDYSGLNLDAFLFHTGGVYRSEKMYHFCFPWVENAADSGIGEWIEFDLSSPQTITYILNGFVDGNRMHLYKANSRMKEAEFTGWTESGKEIKQDVHFEDFVYFKTVQFSEPVTKFRITIKETYPGEKWQDTAISAVMFPTNRK